MELREWKRCVPGYKNMLTLSKTQFLVIEKYIQDAKHDEKHVPDLLEALIILAVVRGSCTRTKNKNLGSCEF